jgi:hypothetical protein
MRKNNKINLILAAVMTLTFAVTALAGSKVEGTTSLKDLQPFGTIDKKTHKHQQFDLSFVALGKQYSCRTIEKDSLKATDFVIGSGLEYEINGDKAKVKSVSGKKVECTIVRVAEAPARVAEAPAAKPQQ